LRARALTTSLPVDQRVVAGFSVATFIAPGLVAVTPPKFDDDRGFLSETYNRQRFAGLGIGVDFIQDNHTLSVAFGTIRGLHFQLPPHQQGKLVRTLRGSVLDVVVDLRHGSPAFGKPVAVELSAENWCQLYIPPGFAHGFCTLTSDAEIHYKMTGYYAPDADRGIAFDDPDLGIDWPIDPASAIVSPRDRRHPRLRDCPAHFRFETSP
jgi:dTDP-4-dehydrorhamnose 3,5-epimerase